MDVPALIAFTWSALAGGIYYDSVKTLLGTAFHPLLSSYNNNEPQSFEDILSPILQSDKEIAENLLLLSQGKDIDSFTVNTGDISSAGSVVIGNNNKIG